MLYLEYLQCMFIKLNEDTIKPVKTEINKLKGKKSLVYLENRLEFINNKKLEEMLQTKILEKVRSVKISNTVLSVFELRGHKGKGSSQNVRALLCGIEQVNDSKVKEIELHVLKVWEKGTNKIPENYIKLAIKRFKEFVME